MVLAFFLSLFLFRLCLFPSAFASTSDSVGQNGVGLFFGEPTGFTFKHWLGSEATVVNAIDAGIAFSFNDFLIFYSDYLWHFPKAIKVNTGNKDAEKFFQQLSPYVGVGGLMFISANNVRSKPIYYTQKGSTMALGVRAPLGLEWDPKPSPIRVYVEFTSGIGILPSTFGFVQGGIGARYYF